MVKISLGKAILLGLSLTSCGNANGVQPVVSVESAANEFTLALIADANATARMESEQRGEPIGKAWKYELLDSKIIAQDMDDDNDQDAVFVVTICEQDSCHKTSQLNAVALFENKEDAYSLNWYKSVDFDPVIEKISGAEVTIKSLIYGDNDPQCCPDTLVRSVLKFRK